MQDIYYRIDPVGWRNNKSPLETTCGSYNFNNYAVNEDCELNIFILGSNLEGSDGCWGSGGLSGEGNNYVNHEIWYKYEDSTAYWTIAYELAHEIGHALGLSHVWLECPSRRNDVYCPHTSGFCDPDENNCSNNMMGYSGEQLHISPSQAGHMRELFLNTWRSKMLNMDYDAGQSVTISGNETWSISRAIRGDITIQSGATLTVECNLLMAPGAKIVVERGGRLNVNGGCITTKRRSCGDRDYWKGIEVIGNPSLSQTTTNQGVVDLDDATIEYASNAITTGTNGVGWQGGGIIYADNTIFRNNRRSVEFSQYTLSDNLSYFNECTFEINDDYPQVDYIGMVTMWDVRGVEFTGCDFINTSSTVGNEQNAVYTIDAAYSMTDGCTFEGFEGGVYSTNSNTTNTFTVDDASFEDNAVGIYAGSVDDIVVTSNTFTVGHYNTSAFNHGVYLDHSSGYQIEANDFDGDDILPSGLDPVGVTCDNSGDDYNKIYRNDYTGFLYANRAIGDNRNGSFTGLEYICNTNLLNSSYDFLVSIDPSQSSSLSGIKTQQGAFSESAGNTFSLNTTPTGADFNNGSVHGITYWYDNGASKEPLNTINLSKASTTNANSCASELSMMMMAQQEGTGPFEAIFSENRQAYDSKMDNYMSLLDGGDTEKLVEEIKMARQSEVAQLTDKLMDLSPWLSAKSLQALIENQDLLKQEELIVLLLNNPDALRDQILFTSLETVLSNEQIDEIKRQTRLQITERTRMESEIGTHFAQMQTAINSIVRYYLSLETIDFAAIRNWLKEKRSVNAAYARVETWLQEYKPDEATAALNSIPKDYDLTEKQQMEFKEYQLLNEIKATAMKQGRSIAELTKAEVASLVEIADREIGRAAVQAKGILNFFYGYQYTPKIMDTSVQTPKNKLNQNLKTELEDHTKISPVHIFPNPTKGEVTFRFDLSAKEGKNGILQIIDLHGKVIKSFSFDSIAGQVQWNTSNVKPGLYFYHLLKQGKIIDSGRFLISK